MANLLDGKKTAQQLKEQIFQEVRKLKKAGVTPGLAVVLVGHDPASEVYVGHKQTACQELGIYSEVKRLPFETTTKELLTLIADLNRRENIHGILVQLPLPEHIDEQKIIDAITPQKDVDGFHPVNVGCLSLGRKTFVPCTPQGIMALLEIYSIGVDGKHAVIIGRSNIVGKPIAALLLAQNATVTICHSHTKNLAAITRQADILVVAIGKPNFVTQSMVKPGAVVIDVGINRMGKKLVGDVCFDEVQEVAEAITPVPGGVGPLTIAMLLNNTLQAARNTLK